ncbi:PRC-barrel domain-containing protein [Pedobacter sp. P26]|uniref:PRC-barrel domain-containing protein n=1 Tax=Pedobacter sp. P26 TaxID=3423956 RepID=UPI003D67CB70
MNSGTIVYSNLEELSNSIYQLTDGEADIKGWPVRNEVGDSVGKVRDLLFDPEQKAIRYVIVELADMGEDLEEKAVLIPIGLVNLGEGKKKLFCPTFIMTSSGQCRDILLVKLRLNWRTKSAI